MGSIRVDPFQLAIYHGNCLLTTTSIFPAMYSTVREWGHDQRLTALRGGDTGVRGNRRPRQRHPRCNFRCAQIRIRKRKTFLVLVQTVTPQLQQMSLCQRAYTSWKRIAFSSSHVSSKCASEHADETIHAGHLNSPLAALLVLKVSQWQSPPIWASWHG